MHVWRILGLTAILAAAWPAAWANATVDPRTQAPLLRAEVQRALRECKIPGAAVGFWTPQGGWAEPFGLADVAAGRKVRIGDRFAIRSITKSFTVTLILDLVAQGKIRLDDPISRYYPGVPKGNAVTLRRLAGMASGVFDYSSDPAFGKKFAKDLTQHWTTAELIAYGISHPSKFQPGSEYDYSNTNTLLLGEVVARVTRRPFAKVIQERIFARLGLSATRYLDGAVLPPPSVKGYDGFDSRGRPDEIAISFSAQGPAGAIGTNLYDLRRWGVALAEGTLLPAALQRQRFWSRVRTNGPLYDRYGLGIGKLDGWWGHTGFGAGYSAAVFHQIDQNRTVAILLNASNFDDVPALLFPRLKAIVDTGKAPSGPICR
jgi:D-alanyl-D-alanine carboxypeptidase